MSGQVIRLKIDQKTVEARPGMTVLECARSNGLFIPSLCDLEGLPAFAGCRLCLVEIAGRVHRSPACQTLVEEGMDIITSSPELEALRLATFELILSEHPYFCLLCQEKPDCTQLKTTMIKALEPGGCIFCPKDGACELQRVAEYLKLKRVTFDFEDRGQPLWQSDPFIFHNPNLCILCGRCVRVCSEVRGENVLAFIGRGPETSVGTFLKRNLRDSDCSFCGACLDVCPVAAFGERGVTATRGQTIYEDSFICPLCGSGCELRAEFQEDGHLRRIVPESGGPALGAACARGRFGLKEIVDLVSDESLPVIRRDTRLFSVSREEALAAAVESLKKYQPEEIALIFAGQIPADGLMAFYQFGRLLGTDRLYYFYPEAFLERIASFECRQGIELGRSIDFKELDGYGSFLLVDIDLSSEALTLWLEMRKSRRRGARLLVLDSGINRSGQTAEVNLQCLPGKETEALLALLKKVILKFPGLSFYPGYERLLAELALWSEEELARAGGLQEREIERAAEVLLSSRPSLFLFGQRLLRQPRWSENLAALWNLGLRLEAGLVPVTGRANELLIPGLKKSFGLQTLPDLEPVEKAIAEGKIKGLYVLGDLPLDRQPDLLIVQNPYRIGLAEKADIFIPAAVCLKSEGLLVDQAGRVKKTGHKARLSANDDRLADAVIMAGLAGAIGKSLESEDYSRCLESVLGVESSERGNAAATYLPLAFSLEKPGKARDSETVGLRAELEVIVGDNLDHYAGLSMAGLSSAFRAIRNPDWLWLNPRDGARLGLRRGQKVVLETDYQNLNLEIKFSSRLRPGSAFINPVLDDSLKIKLFRRGIIKGTVKIKI